MLEIKRKRSRRRLFHSIVGLPELSGASDRDGQRICDVPAARLGVQRHVLSTTRARGNH